MTLHRFGLVALLLAIGAAQAKDDKKPADKKPAIDVTRTVEVRLNEGKRLTGTILTDKIDVDTPYGKLQVPVVEIRRIEMGVRPSAEITAALDKAIKQLGSNEFKEREAAIHQLINMGELAYKTLQRECKNADPEVAKLARNGVERIREKFSEEKLAKLKEDDVIVTERFTMCGRIQTPALKFKSEAGENEVKSKDLRAVRWVGRVADMEVKVEADKHARVNQWFDTKIEVNEDDEVEIKAEGQINLMDDGTGQWVCGPTGFEQWKAKMMGGGRNMVLPGLLMGKIGKDGKSFDIGEKHKFNGKQTGRLYLIIGSPQNFLGEGRSSGSFKVKIAGGREAD